MANPALVLWRKVMMRPASKSTSARLSEGRLRLPESDEAHELQEVRRFVGAVPVENLRRATLAMIALKLLERRRDADRLANLLLAQMRRGRSGDDPVAHRQREKRLSRFAM